ncbi:MAG: hypothetical protein MR284_07765, partial [Clostridiales bacterium]|nr:hypothetical protein [Clostridiales bacterium]
KKIPALQEAVTLKYAGENGAVLSEEQLKEYAEDLRNTGVFTENEIKKYVAKAQMTWDEILHKELEGRNEYHKQQDPKIDSTVKQIEDMLLSKYARTGRASNAKSYINAKKKAGKELSKKIGTAEERTAKANEASLMPPEGVYLRSERLLFSDRDTSLDPRTLLTNALENAAVTEDEKNLLKAYKNQIDILNKQTERLAEIKAEIKDISFGKGKDRSKLPGLEESARKFERAISAKDKQLLKLEATKPLQKVLDREKAAVKKKALQKGREALETYKKKGTAEERTAKASEASLMPPDGVYLYAERDFVTDDEVAKTGRSAAKAPRRNEMHTLFEITVEQNRDISRLNRYDDNYRGKFTGGKQYIYSTFRNKHILKRNPKY